ncbi:hypothetical protein G3I60_05410 [Streptomyces sp. SID13666]|uniref:hypothetical protein n=1 Tax=Streptomyces sp. SID13666 TaxID=2706054 RepID=UPI0013C1AFA0|nr:hypothetical protein [Streptomyces sp. SID13666]NEA53609.1 hypothetical protein [Streptomyces sp. SID13666]
MTMTLDRDRIIPEREPRPLGAIVSQRMLDAMRRGGADLAQLGVPATAEEPGPLWTDVAEPQARARAAIWRNSVMEASHHDYLNWRLADLDAAQKPNVLRGWLTSLVEAKERKGRPGTLHLIAPGRIGTGKTTALAALGNEASAAGLLVRFIKHPTYVSWRRPDGAPGESTGYRVRKQHVECDLLILDELCGEMDGLATEFVRRETVDLIDSRLSAGRPTAFSTNLNRQQITAVLGERLLSRIEDRAHLVKIEGPDRRAPRKPLDW